MLNIYTTIALIFVTIGSYTDIKTLEVPDWLNYSLIAIGLFLNFSFTVFFWDPSFLISSIYGLLLALVLGIMMFYTGQWGGGDSKMLFGLGALFGFTLQPDFFIKFLGNMLFAGAFYGILWIAYKAWTNRKKLKFRAELKKNQKTRIITGIILIASLVAVYFLPILPYIKMTLTFLFVSLYFMNYIYVFTKVIEKVAMVHMIDPKQLTEGDWIVDEIKVDGKYIAGPKDLGIKKKQIKQILELKKKDKIDKVKVKYGMPFVPSFWIGLVITIILNDFLFLYLV